MATVLLVSETSTSASEKTLPVLEYFRARDRLEEIDGGQSPERVFDEVWSVFRRRFTQQGVYLVDRERDGAQ